MCVLRRSKSDWAYVNACEKIYSFKNTIKEVPGQTENWKLLQTARKVTAEELFLVSTLLHSQVQAKIQVLSEMTLYLPCLFLDLLWKYTVIFLGG